MICDVRWTMSDVCMTPNCFVQLINHLMLIHFDFDFIFIQWLGKQLDSLAIAGKAKKNVWMICEYFGIASEFPIKHCSV